MKLCDLCFDKISPRDSLQNSEQVLTHQTNQVKLRRDTA